MMIKSHSQGKPLMKFWDGRKKVSCSVYMCHIAWVKMMNCRNAETVRIKCLGENSFPSCIYFIHSFLYSIFSAVSCLRCIKAVENQSWARSWGSFEDQAQKQAQGNEFSEEPHNLQLVTMWLALLCLPKWCSRDKPSQSSRQSQFMTQACIILLALTFISIRCFIIHCFNCVIISCLWTIKQDRMG